MKIRTTYRNGQKVRAYRDTQATKERQRSTRKWQRETLEANTRAKYGPRMKPAPVVVKRIDEEAPIRLHERS